MNLSKAQEDVFKCFQANNVDLEGDNGAKAHDANKRSGNPSSDASYLRTLYSHLTGGSFDPVLKRYFKRIMFLFWY